ncbi:MAG: DegV family protein [Actinomycetota bacterium]|nr:DegV family protein [Actinomycetota bacterium]
MNKIKIVTDSTADIPKELVEKYGIEVVPLYVNFGEDSYIDDGKSLTKKQFYEKLEKTKKQVTTSQPAPQDFIQAYDRILQDYESIISIHISGKMSGTFNSAQLAKRNFADRDIEIIDSELVHMPLGLLVIKAAELALENRPKEEIIHEVQKLKEKIRVLFIPRSLKYMIKSGRIGRAKGLIASLLKIRPILTFYKGETAQFKTTRRFGQAKDELIKSMKSMIKDTSNLMVVVSDSDAREEEDMMVQRIEDTFSPREIMRAEVGPVVGNHLGPGGITVTFYEK